MEQIQDSENERNPFSQDEEPEKWITTNTNARIPIYEGETKEEAIKNFTKQGGGGNSNGSNITSNEEKEQKIKSVKINPEKDNIFPELNKEEQEKL